MPFGSDQPNNTYQRVAVAMTALTMLLSIVDWIAGPTTDAYSIIIGVVHLALIALVPKYPETGGILILLLELLCSMHGTLGGPSRLWGNALAAGAIVFREGRTSVLIAVVSCNATMQLLQTENQREGAYDIDLMIHAFRLAFIALAGLLGFALSIMFKRQQTRETEHEQSLEQERERHRLQSLDYATQVHDHVSGKLANIVMIGSKHDGSPAASEDVSTTNDVDPCAGAFRNGDADGDAAAEDMDWKLVVSEASQALAEIHDIIELMSGIREREAAVEHTDSSAVERLQRLCDDIVARLEHAGLRGTFTVHDNGLPPNPDDARLMLLDALLDEIGSNIQRHCPQDAAFACSIMLHDAVAEVTQCNPASASADDQPPSTHMGLGLYQDQLLAVGGSLRTTVEDGMWMLYACVPLE